MPEKRTVKKKILFVCTGNTCRSVMAAALARKVVDGMRLEGVDVEIASAGLAAVPGDRASSGAVTVMRERGLDISGHCSSLLTIRDIEDADLVLAMTSGHRDALCRLAPSCAHKIHTLARYAGNTGDVPDPFGRPDHVYRRVAGDLEEMVTAAIKRWCQVIISQPEKELPRIM